MTNNKLAILVGAVAVFLAGAVSLAFLGLAAGIWIMFYAVPLALLGLVGWVYEYYRGNFAR